MKNILPPPAHNTKTKDKLKNTFYNKLKTTKKEIDKTDRWRGSHHLCHLVFLRSCVTNEFFEVVMKEIDEGRAVNVVYMDFSKALDKVPHGRLIQKIQMYGIHSDLVVWI